MQNFFNILMKSTNINRNKMFNKLKDDDNYYLLSGSKTLTRQFSDVEIKFRQDSNFFWLTGLDMPNFQILFNGFYRKIILVSPNYDINYTIWHGKIPDLNKIVNNYNFSSCITKKELDSCLYDEPKVLKLLIENSRIIKNKYEIKIIRQACKISTLIHNKIIFQKKMFIKKNERNIANFFKYQTHEFKYVDNLAYPTIVGSGRNSSILHYTKNDKIIEKKNIVLLDAGCEFMNYASDITTTFPIDDKFDKYQQEIYDIVFTANKISKEMIKEGVYFKDIYFKSLDIIYTGIKDLKLINLAKQKEYNLSNFQVAKLLMPHGLGHFLGLDVHDVGGSLYKYSNEIGLQSEYKEPNNGVKLLENMVITIEPGIYFISRLILKYTNLFTEKILCYFHLGGIRIEDDILVTKNGFEQLNDVVR